MPFESVAKAVELKMLIDHAPKYLPKIGRCPSLEFQFKEERIYCIEFSDDDEIRSRDDKDGEDAKAIQNDLCKLYEIAGHDMWGAGFERFEITVLGKKIKLGEIAQGHVEQWQAAAANSPFGNVATQETQHDARVRSSRELDTTQFEVDKGLLDAIAKKWEQKLIPKKVSVQPYKLLIYGPGDHFQYHKDTPEENLCGTFLISLFSNSKPRNVFELTEDGQTVLWQENSWKDARGWCAFYPDIPHRVIPVESGYRANLSFKVFAKESTSPRKEQTSAPVVLLDDILNKIEKLRTPLGIVLRHLYGYDSKSIYGCDRLLLDGLESKGLHTEVKPILICLDGTGRMQDEEGSVKTKVYPLTEECLDIVRQKLAATEASDDHDVKRRKLDNDGDILFIQGDKRDEDYAKHPHKKLWRSHQGGWWKSDVQEEAEVTGNESRQHSEHSVYVRYAAIVRPKS